VSDTGREARENARYIEQLQKRIDEKDETIEFLQEELTDRRAQISGMKQIIDGQRQLLETINTNVAPVFGALAKLVAPKGRDGDDPIVATMVDDAEREAA
jgi:chromosome segregation ATPase